MLQKPSLTQAEQRYCELLSLLIEEYEERTFPLKSRADAVDVLKELMAANRLRQKDLLAIFKHKALISEILNRKRPLSWNTSGRWRSTFRFPQRCLSEKKFPVLLWFPLGGCHERRL
jgi:HTH-type transcriptional regulator/antitoxin HigA